MEEKLKVTREALRETRDSLEQVQMVIKPLTLAQRAKEQQLQQFGAMNRLYEAKIAEYETKIRQAEATIQRQVQQSAASVGDEFLIEKLHERLTASQNALVKCQSDLQRLQVISSSSNAELVEARRNVSALEVQLLVEKQAHQQSMKTQLDQATARENSLFIELAASKRRLAGLEEQVQLQLSLREASRKEEELQSQAALAEEIRVAMNKISRFEESRNDYASSYNQGAASPILKVTQQSLLPNQGSSLPSPGRGSPPVIPSSSGSPPFGSFSAAADSKHSETISTPQTSSNKTGEGSGGKKAGFFSRAMSVGFTVSSPTQKNKDSKPLTIDLDGGIRIKADQIVQMDDAGSEDVLGSPNSSTSSEINVPILFRPLGDISDEVNQLEEEKERTVKAIKEWTDAFVKANNREPTTEDVSRSPEIKALYDEMEEVCSIFL
jgi:hypothetical protein